MKKGDSKSIIIIFLSIIIVILSALIVLFATGTINLNSKENNSNDVNLSNKDKNKNTQNDEDKSNNNDEKIDESNYIRQTKVTLIDEPNCTGNSSPRVATIEADGKISISQNGGAGTIETRNAKYLYSVGILACDRFKLYYITEDNNLYVIDNPDASTSNQKAVKATESKVIEFLGTEVKDSSSYLKVLLENKNIEYIKYLSRSN